MENLKRRKVNDIGDACHKRPTISIGMERVKGYYKTVHGKRVHVREYERKSHDRLTAHDREVDHRNAAKGARARRRE